ncbi:MAG: M1 family metallopeptidase [Bacteroidales bacterium]|jgi:aminopeptidase N|nr:M1 family metallopeptidase [Bacteroidales bacterium]
MKTALSHIVMLLPFVVPLVVASGQPCAPVFTRQDTLRGSITPERKWWDVVYYHLSVDVNPSDSSVKGSNTVFYKILEPGKIMQIDLQEPMSITHIVQNEKNLAFRREGSVYWIRISNSQAANGADSVTLYFEGRPPVADKPPWTPAFTWSRDRNGMPFIANANQGAGASVWWPCKDHMYDEPDSMLISVTVSENLTDVSNGRLRSVIGNGNGTRTFNWFVTNPINIYGVNINIADYAHFSEVFHGEGGKLDCSYYVLKENLEKARKQFRQVPMMLEAFEYWFGRYPFYEDSYKLVEAPYLGMEHQSSVTYGNGFRNGYRGADLSDSGWGMKFDYIIIHESGHEWFANSITYNDVADMWVHESFTSYSESLYLEYFYGKDAGREYVLGLRRNILNDRPVTGVYGVNHEGSGDMYWKGANMLHTLRQIVGNDGKWRSILREMNTQFYHTVVTGTEIESFLSEKTGIDLRYFFDQYLRDVRIPVFEYYVNDGRLMYRWNNCVDGFNMPVRVFISGSPVNLRPTTSYASVNLGISNPEIKVDPNYYAGELNITGE